ncbi:MAG: CsgG/HfaB family protein [Mariprofundaceae bacterium]
MPRLLLVMSLALFLCSCANTYAVVENPDVQIEPVGQAFSKYHGEQDAVAVIPLGLSAKAAERYPHLRDKSVGFGIHNILMDFLFETKRFKFVEDKQSVITNTFKWHELSQSGLVDSAAAVQIGKMLSAKKVIYGEVYDYSEGGSESVVAFSASKRMQIRVGIQIRIVDVETLEVIPASGVGYGADWGLAAKQALYQAVRKVIKRY